MLFALFQDQEEEEKKEEEINYPFQVTLPAKDNHEESNDETNSDSSSDENLPGLLGAIAKRSKSSYSENSDEGSLNLTKNDEDVFHENPKDLIPYTEIIHESGIEWAIELAKEIQMNKDLSKKSHDSSIDEKNKFEPVKFQIISKRSPRILRNVLNDFKLELSMDEILTKDYQETSLYSSDILLSKRKKFAVDDSSDDAFYNN